jgi:hypothetical protein
VLVALTKRKGVDVLISCQIKGAVLAGINAKPNAEQGIVTVKNAEDFNAFCSAFLNAIAQHRHRQPESMKETVPA